jgi:hypothetical protein
LLEFDVEAVGSIAASRTSFLNSAADNAKINDGAMVQSMNIQGSATNSNAVPIQISPTTFAGNRHVWLTLTKTGSTQVVARVEAIIFDNHGWSPASGFQIISVSHG